MMTDEELNELRLNGSTVRIIRDENRKNDVIGIIVAWNDKEMLVRKRNRKVVKLPRTYKLEIKT